MACTNDHVDAITAEMRYCLPIARRYVDVPELIIQYPPKDAVVCGNGTDGKNLALMFGREYASPASIFSGVSRPLRQGRKKSIGPFVRHFGSPFRVVIPRTRHSIPITNRGVVENPMTPQSQFRVPSEVAKRFLMPSSPESLKNPSSIRRGAPSVLKHLSRHYRKY